MRQRPSVARALAMNAEFLLSDEPLWALDALTLADLADEILDIWEQDKKTCILITNDVDEAILLADRVVMITNGPHATIGKIVNVGLRRPRPISSCANVSKFAPDTVKNPKIRPSLSVRAGCSIQLSHRAFIPRRPKQLVIEVAYSTENRQTGQNRWFSTSLNPGSIQLHLEKLCGLGNTFTARLVNTGHLQCHGLTSKSS